jgi:chaperonin GroES
MGKDDKNKLKNLAVVGDRVLIKPKKISNKSKGGLFLPPGYHEKE